MVSDSKCVVNVSTESYQRGKTFFRGRTLRVLERLSNFNVIEDEVDALGTHQTLMSIINLDEVEDGVYYLTYANIQYDWESGHPDSWDLKLVPYEPS